MKKHLVLLSVFTLIVSYGYCQGTFKFEKESHDFGAVEEGKLAIYEFVFKNTGNQPIIISNVKASCGCTTPFWTREPVPPGGTGKVKAQYNSKGRPGTFAKSITITSNSQTPTKVLRINGVVNKKPARVLTPEELAQSPVIQFEKSTHNFGKVEIGQTVSYKFSFSNKGKNDLKITNVQSRCRCVTHQASKQVIKPGETAQLTLTYTPRGKSVLKEVVTINSNDLTQQGFNITLIADLVESLVSQSILREDKASVPFK